MAQAKRVNFEIIQGQKGEKKNRQDLYDKVNSICAKHHTHLSDTEVALAWCMNWTEDVDGHVKLYDVKKCDELNRQLHGCDFIIVLNHPVWNAQGFTTKMANAVLDEALTCCEVSRDSDGEIREDENGRTVYRIRKPDCTVFPEIVARHGLMGVKLQDLARAIRDNENMPLFDLPQKEEEAEETASSNGHTDDVVAIFSKGFQGIKKGAKKKVEEVKSDGRVVVIGLHERLTTVPPEYVSLS